MPFHRRPCKPKDDDEEVGATASPLDSYLAELEGLGYKVKVVDVSARPLPEMRQRVWMLRALPDSGYDVTLWASQVEELEKICSGKPVAHMASMMRLIKGAEQTPAAELTGPPKEESWASDASYHKSFGRLLSKARAEKSLIVKSVDKRASNKFSCLKQATEWQKANVDACEALLGELCRQVPNVRTSVRRCLADMRACPPQPRRHLGHLDNLYHHHGLQAEGDARACVTRGYFGMALQPPHFRRTAGKLVTERDPRDDG